MITNMNSQHIGNKLMLKQYYLYRTYACNGIKNAIVNKDVKNTMLWVVDVLEVFYRRYKAERWFRNNKYCNNQMISLTSKEV